MPIAASRGEPPPTSSLELVACGCNGFKAARLMPDSECLAFYLCWGRQGEKKLEMCESLGMGQVSRGGHSNMTGFGNPATQRGWDGWLASIPGLGIQQAIKKVPVTSQWRSCTAPYNTTRLIFPKSLGHQWFSSSSWVWEWPPLELVLSIFFAPAGK